MTELRSEAATTGGATMGFDTTKATAGPIAVTGGLVAGRVENRLNVFRGVPYAASLEGRNRWRPPQPVEPWSGVRDATRNGKVCHQAYRPSSGRFLARRMPAARAFLHSVWHHGVVEGDDCLNLNVFTPTLDPQARLAVLCWIHGGGFIEGAGSAPQYEFHALAAKGIVVVSINYRLNVWGFMGGDDLFPGDVGVANRGHLDQLEALRWINRNIRSFGGDPDRVTVAGESAGATCAVAMLSSPKTDGLLRRVASFSGGAISHFPHNECSRFARDFFSEVLGVRPGDADALCGLSVEETRKAAAGLNKFLARRRERYGSLGLANFTLMHQALGTELLPRAPIDYIRTGNKRGVDLMIGTCRDDSRLWTVTIPLPDQWAAKVMFDLHKGVMNPRDNPGETFRNYRAAMPGATATQVRERAMTDALFRKWSVELANVHAHANPGQTWLYRFDWASPAVDGRLGAIHVLDLPGFFQLYEPFRTMVGDEQAARPVGAAQNDAFVGFIKSGRPAGPSLPPWSAYNTTTKPCMIFDKISKQEHDIDRAFEPIW